MEHFGDMALRRKLLLAAIAIITVSAIPLVSANPVPDFKHTSAFVASHVALVILVVAIVDSAIFLVRRKKLAKQGLLYLSALSCWVTYLVTRIYGGTYSVATAIGNRITAFGFVAIAVTYLTMAVTLVAIAYSGYLIGKRVSRVSLSP